MLTALPRFALCLVTATAALFTVSIEARAEWTLCNHTSYVLRAAVAYPESGGVVSNGWLRLRPNECQIARSQRLSPGTHYFYAEASKAHRGGLREAEGDTPLCVLDGDDFTITGAGGCEEAGFQTRPFISVDIAQPTWRMTIEESEGFNAQRSGAAGLQRLLRDNGYDVEVIDGYTGRRTVRAMNQFLTDNDLSQEPPAHELIDILEAAALAAADQTGLHLCNSADGRIWTAIAVRRGEAWESRGWWPLEPTECSKVVDNPPDSDDSYYVYASLERGERERTLVGADETFCLAETKFAILGRVNCEARGYQSGPFMGVTFPENEQVLTMQFRPEDFDRLAPTSGRRR